MEIKEMVHSGMVVESMMENTYRPSEKVQSKALNVPEDIIDKLKKELEAKKIYISDEHLLKKIISDVIKGNLILQGPPGTGKTVMAEAICNAFNVVPIIVTAVDDWTTYDTIGGLAPDVEDKREIIVGKNGRVVEAIIRCCDVILREDAKKDTNQAAWIIIDELNRSEIDKVFGDLFTVMGSNDPTEKYLSLWFHNDVDKKKLYVPNRFRIIGTMNTVDKDFVNNLSQALSRRFSMETIMPPAIDSIEKEIALIKEGAKERVKYKIEAMSDSIIDDVYADSNFSTVEKLVIDFIKHLRYSSDSTGDSSLYAGVFTGSAQIKDLYETVLINLYIEGNKLTDEIIKEVFDRGVESELIPQLKAVRNEQKMRFRKYFEDAYSTSLTWMKNTKIALEAI